jgi:hypothetical protein
LKLSHRSSRTQSFTASISHPRLKSNRYFPVPIEITEALR